MAVRDAAGAARGFVLVDGRPLPDDGAREVV
jgi:hypothetical protein